MKILCFLIALVSILSLANTQTTTLCGTGCSQCPSQNNCTVCEPGFFLSNASCSPCGSGCITCQNNTSCTQCNTTSNFTLVNGTCTPPPVSAPPVSTSGNVSLCGVGCSQCPSQNNCTACTPGYFVNNASCSPCGTGCLTCQNNTTCLQCNTTSDFTLANGTCTLIAAGGAVPVFTPIVCNIQFCHTCQNTTACGECNTGYSVQNGSCIATPGQTVPAATVPPATGPPATQPTPPEAGGSGSAGATGSTTVCSVPNCLTCSASGSVCGTCQSGYYSAAGGSQCILCPANCISCSSATGCTACNASYYLAPISPTPANSSSGTTPVQASAQNTCAVCSSNCTICNNATYCLNCTQGFQLLTIANGAACGVSSAAVVIMSFGLLLMMIFLATN